VRFGPFQFRIERGELTRDEEAIRLSEREREILTILALARGGNVEREALTGTNGAANERTVDVQMNRLRRRIEDDPANPRYVQTVRGVGYRLVLD
jgi:two-component system phosphate regulon response regulator OmpR